MNWAREGRHDRHSCIFFTLTNGLGLLIVAALVFDLVRPHVSP
jgi:hypothetical protein